ncbi:integrase, catalytic region, partial [mine drainage metagenome]
MLAKRGRVKERTNQSAPELIASTPNDIWSTDITYLPGPILGLFFYLYVV